MTIDDLAAAAEREFQAIHDEMDAFKDTQTDILKAVEKIDLHLSSYASHMRDELGGLREWVGDVDGRMKFIERSNQ